MERVSETFEDQSACVVDCTDGHVFGEDLGGLVELEPGKNVESEALAVEGEEMASSSPSDEL